ncbi:MAG: NUDIX hydrolase [Alphaproteobacteria bacterium]
MKKQKIRRQYAALPYRWDEAGARVLLVTSLQTRRWIIPKGWPEKSARPHELAAREAFEEAGLTGPIDAEPFGAYTYEKTVRTGRSQRCRVDVFLMRVERELDAWPERGRRERRWLPPAEAALLVTDGGLVDLLLRFAAIVAASPDPAAPSSEPVAGLPSVPAALAGASGDPGRK